MNLFENSPPKGHKKNGEVRARDIRGEAETAVTSYSSEQKNWVNLIPVYEYLLRRNKEDGAKIFSGCPMKGQVTMGTKEILLCGFSLVYFTVTVAEHWHKMDRETVESPS